MHEAAHAVVHALVGTYVHSLEVHPLDVEMGSSFKSMGEEPLEAAGVCRTSRNPVWRFLEWDQEEYYMKSDVDGFRAYTKMIGTNIPNGRNVTRQLRREMRGWVCAVIAGDIATQILEGVKEGEIYLDSADEEFPCDIDKAYGICGLLPFRFSKEFDNLAEQTERILRTPEVWGRVLNLANLLEDKGVVGEEEMIPFLPHRLSDWPKAPHRQTAASLQPEFKLAA
ncbi:hypothetical protein [Geomonas ferrireducens]|uniref:hypothetical protein n=1 Tax=Geomonas ferrireducens TaxID=2570227 RepID=UPI0010A7B2F0|nr:hypothetical protein [Geomonas ferrireducens]